jgi:hypothetical protein
MQQKTFLIISLRRMLHEANKQVGSIYIAGASTNEHGREDGQELRI